MFGLYFRGNIPSSYTEVMECDVERLLIDFSMLCLQEGIYFAPSAFEAGFVSASLMVIWKLANTLKAAEKIFSTWK